MTRRGLTHLARLRVHFALLAGILTLTAFALITVSSVHYAGSGSVKAQSDPPANHKTTCTTQVKETSGSQGFLTGDLANDCAWLLSIETTLEGDNNSAVINWSTSTALSSWTGIQTSGTPKRVTRIGLDSHGLKGQIPPELGKLTDLEGILLSNNKLTGGIPKELGNLTKLIEVRVSNNYLTGMIPPELGSMTKLATLDFQDIRSSPGDNQLTGPIPAELGNLSELTTLFLGNNNLEGTIPTQLGNLSKLTTLQLSGNNLTGTIPKELGNLTALNVLELADNDLSGSIPTEVVPGMTGLQRLILSYNRKLVPSTGSSSILEDISPMTNLRGIHLDGIDSMKGADLGQLAIHLSGMTQLRALYLSDNDITGSLSSLTDLKTGNELVLKNLVSLVMRNNKLTGSIPDELNDMNLYYLDLRGNLLTGSIPDLRTMSTFPSGVLVLLSHNQLTGTLTTDQGESKFPDSLSYLWLNNNQLTGHIPDLSSMTSLLYLYLNNNQLTGTLTTDQGELKFPNGVRYLHLNDNALTGAIPDFSGMTSLLSLHLHNNNFTGSIQTLNVGTQIELIFDIGDTSVYISIPSGAVPAKYTNPKLNLSVSDASSISSPQIQFPATGRHFVGINAVDANNVDIDSLETQATVCVKIPSALPASSTLYHLGDASGAAWTSLDAPLSDDLPEKFRTGYACGKTQEFSTFATGVAILTTPTPISGQLISRIEPNVRTITLPAKDRVRLSVNIYGVQDILDNSLADDVTFEWTVEPSGGTLREAVSTADDDTSVDEHEVLFITPSQAGRYTVKASLDRYECRDDDNDDGCTAEFQITVRRAAATPVPTVAPQNPAGEIPIFITDAHGNIYTVFTPEEGGHFEGDNITVSADPGAVPNGEIIGVRADPEGPASNVGQTEDRVTLDGIYYSISAVDASGYPLNGYRLDDPAEVCIPVPSRLKTDISEVTMVSVRDDGTLATLSSSIRLGTSGVKMCAALSTLSAKVAAAHTGSPSALPSPTPLPTPIDPDTGGTSPPISTSGLILLIILGSALGIPSLTLIRNFRNTV